MATITGSITRLNSLDTVFHARGAAVFAVWNGKTVATGITDEDEQFVLELPDDVLGEIEIRLDRHQAAPVTAVANGNDLDITMLYNNQQHYG